MYNFKKIEIVSDTTHLIDSVLSKTNRKTPTQNHAGWKISRIRKHQMKKVKFCAEAIQEKLDAILTQFPKLSEIHPFQADLVNILYDKDHYKIALSQINSCKTLIEKVERDQMKLLKQADSQQRAKTLKRAGLGRMVTILRKLKSTLPYLEQIRQHMSRLPSIDPYFRSLLIVGQPNVGKSSFMNAITCANVDVQNQPFTTKSLQVGHCDQLNNNWQVIDSPGILDHPIEEMNTIEMQSICAFAHLDACILFFLDLSESCGYLIEDQLSLLKGIRPLFKNKPIILVYSKADILSQMNLETQQKQKVDDFLKENPKIRTIELSTVSQVNIGNLKQLACELFTDYKLKQDTGNEKANKILSRMHIAIPKKRDDVERTPVRPDLDPMEERKVVTAKDLQEELGGAGVFFIPSQQHFKLENADWNFDKVPEFMDGMNVADFLDPDIEAKLDKLELEEAEQEKNMVVDVDDPTSRYQQLKGEQNRIKTFYKDKSLNKFLEDKFKGKKVKADSILNRLKNDNRISAELKSKIKERMQNDSDSDSVSDGTESSTNEDGNNTVDGNNNESKKNNTTKSTTQVKSMSSERQRIHDRLSELRAQRNKKLKSLKSDKEVDEMQDESNEQLREREKQKKLEILKVKESKLKRNLSLQLKRKGKNDETDRKIETKRPEHIYKGKRQGFKFNHR